MPRKDLPAILGGAPLRQAPLPTYNTIGDCEKDAVLKVLERGELSGFVAADIPEFYGGPKVLELEAMFRERFDTAYAVAVNSATSGLYCMLMAMGIEPGDEVITSPYTMHATASMILQAGGVPVFADIEDETFGLDPASVEAHISPSTKGILAVNIFGHAARLHELKDIADKHGLWLLEDNAQAPAGKTDTGAYTAKIGKAGVFSLNRHKTMQCGEGGVVITDDPDIALRMQLVRNHGECVVGAMGLKNIANTMGQNLRMTEMEAAVACCQFAKLDQLNTDRIRLAERLSAGFKDVDGITPPVVRPGCKHVYYFYVMRYDAARTGLPRQLLAEAVAKEGFAMRAGYLRPIYLEPLFQQKICFGSQGFPFSMNPRNAEISYARGICPTCERLQDQEVLLTHLIYPPFTEEDMQTYVAAVRRILAHAEEITAKHSATA